MKRIYIVMLFAALATITYAQTDDKAVSYTHLTLPTIA